MSDGPARVAAAIIAGGESRRLGGRDKSALVVGGRTIAERQLEVLRPRFSRVFAVSARPEPWRSLAIEVVPDRAPPGSGPLAGIDAALAALATDEAAVVCVGCDMPFLSGALLDRLREAAPEADVVVPQVSGHPEPLLARYSRACTTAVEAALRAQRLKTADLLERVAVHFLSESELRTLDATLASFDNINTPEDLARASARNDQLRGG